jgi:hypothetical protein
MTHEESNGLTADEIEDATITDWTYLAAILEAHASKLPMPSYVKPFIPRLHDLSRLHGQMEAEIAMLRATLKQIAKDDSRDYDDGYFYVKGLAREALTGTFS